MLTHQGTKKNTILLFIWVQVLPLHCIPGGLSKYPKSAVQSGLWCSQWEESGEVSPCTIVLPCLTFFDWYSTSVTVKCIKNVTGEIAPKALKLLSIHTHALHMRCTNTLMHCTNTHMHCTNTHMHCTNTHMHCTNTLMCCTNTHMHCTPLQASFHNIFCV